MDKAQHIARALQHLQQANYAGYFDEMDEVVPPSLMHAHQTHKGVFIAGQQPFNFYQQLETFAKQVEKTLNTPDVVATANPTETVTTKPKILFLAANPTDGGVLQSDKEYRLMSERMRRNEFYELLRPELSVTIENLLIAMNQKPQIVHFSGHGKQEGILISNAQNESQLMSTRALKRLFKQHQEGIQLILLNSCYSEEQAKAISELNIHIVGMSDEVDDAASIDFASGIYIGLSEGKAIEACYDDAMIMLETNHPYAVDLPKVWKDGALLDW